MANYHFTVKVMSRADNRNAVAGATYRHGQSMTDEKSGKRFIHTTDQDVEHCELSIPENSPKWAKDLLVGDVHKNSEKLWNAVERFEKRIDAQVYRDVEFSLPHELTKEQRLELAREFIKEQFTARGMIADWCVHNHFDEKDNIEKPHVHAMLTMRELKETETLEKIKGALGFSASTINFGQKVRDWNSKYLLKTWRVKWAECANTHLSKAGLDIRIDHRSYEDQGVEFIPQPKLGKAVSQIQERGLHVDRLTQMQEVQQYNLNLIRKNPEIVLDYISRYQSTFTREDMARVLNRYVNNSDEFMVLFAKIEGSSKLVKLTGTEKGEASLLTMQEIIKLESRICDLATTLSPTSSCAADPSIIEVALEKGHERLKQFGGLSSDQERAIRHMVSDGQLKVIVGYAGAGKTTSLEVAHEIWRESGYRVVGAAPTGKAAANLEAIGIPSQTFHKWEREWTNGREQLNNNCILILDEAGMVDTRKVHSLLSESQAQGFKVVFVGDPEQLPPIEAGAPVRAIMEHVGFAEISTIVRQQVEWQKEATQDLALRQTEKALEAYDQNGHVYWGEKAKEELIKDWAAYCSKESVFNPNDLNSSEFDSSPRESSRTALILAYFNKDVKKLNDLAREEARAIGRLEGPDYPLVITKQVNLETLDCSDEEWNAKALCLQREVRNFALGEQIVFLRNDTNLNVKNGQLGTITDIQEKTLTVEKDNKELLTFDMDTYSFVDHGYATTIHKSQGTTVDKTFVYASSSMNRHLTYVALSRHREDVQIYADINTFDTKEDFIKTLSQVSPKENVLDHISLEEQKAFMQRRSISSVASYISWDAIKGLTYKVWSQAKDWMFGDMSHYQSVENSAESSRNVNASIDSSAPETSQVTTDVSDLPKLPQASLSALEVQTVKETLAIHDFNIPDGLQEKQYHQLVANTFSYLKAIQLDDVDTLKERELLMKACFIQCSLHEVDMDWRNQDWPSEKILAITAMASHLWYDGKKDTSYAFKESCVSRAVNLQQSYHEQLPRLVENYQQMFPDLPENQLHTLAQQTMYILEVSDQRAIRENLEAIGHSFLDTVDGFSQKIVKEALSLDIENNLFLQSLLKDRVFGETVHENAIDSSSMTPQALIDLSELPSLSISEAQLKTIKETVTNYCFDIPVGISEEQYNQLVAHTSSYLKTIQLGDVDTMKEKELLVKACFIQCHLQKVATYDERQDWSTQKILAITAMASHLWYEDNKEPAYSFTQSYLSRAIDLQQSYQDQLPKVIDNYQWMYSNLPENQLYALAQQAMHIFQVSDQRATRENLEAIAHAFLNTTDSSISGELSKETLTEKESTFSSESLAHDPTEKHLSPPRHNSLSMNSSFEKATAHLLEQYRQQEHQLGLSHEKELNFGPELER
jgi:Ti-type conjugative transfer relaxase TraA